MKVYLKENSWIAKLAAWKLKMPVVAITLGKTIHLHHASRKEFLERRDWVCHELVHVKQFEHYGYYRFLWLYLWESLRKGYYNNKWEQEARALETDHTLLEDVEFG